MANADEVRFLENPDDYRCRSFIGVLQVTMENKTIVPCGDFVPIILQYVWWIEGLSRGRMMLKNEPSSGPRIHSLRLASLPATRLGRSFALDTIQQTLPSGLTRIDFRCSKVDSNDCANGRLLARGSARGAAPIRALSQASENKPEAPRRLHERLRAIDRQDTS